MTWGIEAPGPEPGAWRWLQVYYADRKQAEGSLPVGGRVVDLDPILDGLARVLYVGCGSFAELLATRATRPIRPLWDDRNPATAGLVILADAYDAVCEARGDPRRALGIGARAAWLPTGDPARLYRGPVPR